MEYSRNLIVRVYNRGFYNYLLKSSSVCNFRCNSTGYSQPNTKLVDDVNPLKKITNLSEFVERRHRSGLKKINHVLQVENISKFTQEQKNLLFYSCGKLLSNRSLALRRRLCEEVFEKIKSSGELTVTDCNMYIQICTENETEIDFREFIKKVELKNNEETYKLLLENACEMGNISMAYEILSEMKERKFTIDKRVFNSLILGSTIKSGLPGSETVLATMRATHISPTSDTYWNILKGLASNGNEKDFLKILSDVALQFDDGYFMQILLKLGLNNCQNCLIPLKQKFKLEIIPRNLTHVFDHLCINLIHRAKAKVAVEIYCSLCEPNSDTRFLLEEIVRTDINSNETIIEIAEYLKNIGKNVRSFEDFYDISLRLEKTSLSWDLIEKLDHLRPHYFWPLIAKAGEQHGETGIFETLTKMKRFNVEIDMDTLELYSFPHCDFSDPKALIERMQMLELPLKTVLTPILNLLLQRNKVTEANNLCDEFKVSVQGNRMIKPLANAWIVTKNSKKCVALLKRMSETNESSIDISGSFLLNISKTLNNSNSYNEFYSLLKEMSIEKLLITPANSEVIQKILQSKKNCTLLKEIEEKLENLVDMSVTGDKILHPRNMSLQELECHLTELQSKNKETRGVLRRLIQFYTNKNNNTKVEECLDLFKKSGYELSAGMKSSLMQSYVNTGNLNKALSIFEELRRDHSDFNIDHFKVLNLATLMIKSQQFKNALDFLNKELRLGVAKEPSLIVRNCCELLSSCANPTQAQQLFELLRDRGYCHPTNVILGSIARSYLNNNDFDGAVNFYTRCSKEYRCTPLQLELIYGAIDEKNESKLKEIINATADVHGVQNAHMALLAGLAERGLVVPLNRLILDMQHLPPHLLQLRCKRWVKEGKIDPLVTLDKATFRLSPKTVDRDLILTSIGRIHVKNNDCESSIRFCRELIEREIRIPKDLGRELNRLFFRNKFKVPDDLLPFIKS